jgi:hypothetical protein
MSAARPQTKPQTADFQPAGLQPADARLADFQLADAQPVVEVIDAQMAAVLRAKTGAERLRIASGMYASARRMLLGHLRAEHPDWDERQVAEVTARRLAIS